MHDRYRIAQPGGPLSMATRFSILLLLTMFTLPGVCRAMEIPPELTHVTVMDDFIPLGSKPVGIINSLSGSVIVSHTGSGGAYVAAEGDALYAGDAIYTGSDGRCRLRLVTDDLVSMGSSGRIDIDQVLDDKKNQAKRSRFSMFRGKAMFYVMRLLRYRRVEAEVVTPTAICGVRGTKFGVEVVSSGALPSAGAPPAAAATAATATVVLGFEGTVAVTATGDGSTSQVGPGQQVDISAQGAGSVVAAPPAAAAGFLEDVSVPGDADSETDQTPTTEDPAAAPPGDQSTTPADDTQQVAESTDFQQNETTQIIVNESSDLIAGKRYGYFAALLTRYNSGYSLADIYRNDQRVNFDGTGVKGTSIVDGAGYLEAFGTENATDTTPYIKRIYTAAGGPADSGDLGTTRQMDNPENAPGWPGTEEPLGSNDYMEWGFWRMSKWVPMGAAGTYYAITDRAYYIQGIPTSDTAAAGISGTYAGQAWGTYWNGTTGTDMVGSFSCDVNVAAKRVSNFTLGVSGGGKTASISGGTGGFSGTGGEFKVTGGTWTLSGGAAVSKSLSGTLYGPSGEYMGGSWAMDVGGGNNAAVGIFQGEKDGTPSTPSVPTTLPSAGTP